jgi:hypothetical protein
LGRPLIGGIVMPGAERQRRYMAGLRARALRPAIYLDWELMVDDDGNPFLSADAGPYQLFVSPIDGKISWWVHKHEDDDNVDVAEGDAPSLVVAMEAVENAYRQRAVLSEPLGIPLKCR